MSNKAKINNRVTAHYRKNILGVRVDFGLDKEDFLEKIVLAVEKTSPSYVCTVNPEFIMQAQNDPEFMKLLNESYLNTPDGAGVLMADKYDYLLNKYKVKNPILKFGVGLGLGILAGSGFYKLGPKLAGADLIYDICELASNRGYSVMFLGGWLRDRWGNKLPTSGNLSEKTAQKMKELFPNLKVVFSSSEMLRDPQYDEINLAKIKEAMLKQNINQIDIAFVAFNSKHQEDWLRRNMKKIPLNFGIGVGGSYEFVTGYTPRAPKVLTLFHLEWLHRLITEPWRVKRVFIAFPTFPLQVFIRSLK